MNVSLDSLLGEVDLVQTDRFQEDVNRHKEDVFGSRLSPSTKNSNEFGAYRR